MKKDGKISLIVLPKELVPSVVPIGESNNNYKYTYPNNPQLEFILKKEKASAGGSYKVVMVRFPGLNLSPDVFRYWDRIEKKVMYAKPTRITMTTLANYKQLLNKAALDNSRKVVKGLGKIKKKITANNNEKTTRRNIP